MKSLFHLFNRKNLRLRIVGISGSIILGLPLIASTTLAQMRNAPYRDNQLYDRRLIYPDNHRDFYEDTSDEPIPTSTPLPENEIKADATISPNNETVDIRLQNQTNVPVSYQVIGHTDFLTIEGGRQIMLRNIPLPATVGLVREDDGMLKVMPVSSNSDMLNVVLEEDQYFDDVQGTLRVQEDGQVFVY